MKEDNEILAIAILTPLFWSVSSILLALFIIDLY